MGNAYSLLSGMGDRVQASSSAGAEEDSNPACQSCRRRKLKCPRESPSCSQCIRLGPLDIVFYFSQITLTGNTEVECVYTSTKKPGMKSGAIEALNRRLRK
ncbi:MAG: hypothetical protein CL912_32465 [Deltaproteobacteria bacterium]|nr:hypothetical protein [Deltaproteobacteria bacterium]